MQLGFKKQNKEEHGVGTSKPGLSTNALPTKEDYIRTVVVVKVLPVWPYLNRRSFTS